LNKIAAVILAAGSSSRMGGIKKEFFKIDNEPHLQSLTVLGKSVSAFWNVPSVDTIVIVVPENGEKMARNALPQDFLASETPKLLFVNGGQTRRASVFNALEALTEYSSDYVLIHDGARPWLSQLLVENIIEAVKKHDAVIPVLSVTDTPKIIESEEHFVTQHLKRAIVGLAQTPQGFKFPEILYAHEKAASVDEEFTDDAEIWDRFRGKVAVIPGENSNRKITFPEDLN